jgi:hypothetical protein
MALLRWTIMPVSWLTRRLAGNSSWVRTRDWIADLQRHHQLFQRAVARALADAVDGAFHAARAAFDRRQRVGDRQAQVVVAVHVHHHVLQLRDVLVQVGQQLAELLRHGEADRVGDVHRRGARGDHRADHFGQELRLGARGVLGAELHVLAELFGIGHAFDRLADDLVLRLLQLEFAVDRARREEHVDPRAVARRLQRLGALLDVALHAARQPRDAALLDFRGDFLHRLEVARRRRREARLDDVHVQLLQLPRHLQLLVQAHARAGALLPVAQRRVENNHVIRFFHIQVPVLRFLSSNAGNKTPAKILLWRAFRKADGSGHQPTQHPSPAVARVSPRNARSRAWMEIAVITRGTKPSPRRAVKNATVQFRRAGAVNLFINKLTIFFQSGAARRRGSRASRRASPSRLKASTTAKIAAVTAASSHHMPCHRRRRAEAIIVPQLGWPCAPIPKKSKTLPCRSPPGTAA